MTEHKNLLDALTEGRTLPDGYDMWGIKSTRPDLRTREEFRWPWPGNATEYLPLDADNNDSCPIYPGDGVCVATTWEGMASGGYSAVTLLLVAYRNAEARGGGGKVRVPQAFVVDVVDGARLVRSHGRYADLRGANLRYANLRYANLRYANLQDANLRGADLRGADLRYTDLRYVNLRFANLRYANLRDADVNALTTWPEGFDPDAAGVIVQ